MTLTTQIPKSSRVSEPAERVETIRVIIQGRRRIGRTTSERPVDFPLILEHPVQLGVQMNSGTVRKSAGIAARFSQS